jgi:hypothetical protein
MKASRKIGQLPHPVGDMPAVEIQGVTYVLGGGAGHELRDEILRVEADGRVAEVGRMPVGLRGHQAIAMGDAVYVLGGFAEGTRADVFRLDVNGWRATPLSPMPRGAAWFSATPVGRRIYVVGGFSIPEGYWSDMAVYDVDADRWELLESSFSNSKAVFPRGRLGSNAAIGVAGKLLSFGGADQFDEARTRANALGICAEFDLATRQWRPLSGKIEPREGLVAARAGQVAYLVGGMPEASETPVALVERVDLETGQVTEFGRLAIPRLTPAVSIANGRLLVIGGVTRPPFEVTAEIEAFDLD